MEAYRTIISPEAAADLSALHAYISQDSAKNAARMVERILEAIETLKTTIRHGARRRPRKFKD